MFSRICRSQITISVIKQPVYILNSFRNINYSVNMPPKRKNVASKEVESEAVNEIPSEIPKKRGKKAEPVVPTEIANGDIPAKPQKKTNSAVKAETKPGKKTTKPTDKNAKVPEEKAKPEEKVEKRLTRKQVEKPEDNKEKKEKAPAKSQKPGPSGEKKETKETTKKQPTKAKAKVTKNTEKGTKAKGKTESSEKPALLNTSETKWEQIDFGCKKRNPEGENFNLKITSWNVDGLRAWLKKGGLNILTYDKPDILCLQETKCSESKLPAEAKEIEGYHHYWCSGDKEGYAGVGVYTKKEPLNIKDGIDVEQHDEEGRCLTLEYPDFYLVNVYVPNAGRKLVTLDKRLDWNDAFMSYIEFLDGKKPVILCGDMNVAHNEIDLSNPQSNKKNAGFTQEERDGMTSFLSAGYVDSFRELYPEQTNVYTFWSYMMKARSKNIGWRLDYFILSRRIMKNVCDNVVRTEVYGSDHCPITLFLNI